MALALYLNQTLAESRGRNLAIVGLMPQWSIFGFFLAIAKLDPKQFGKEFSVTFDL